MPAQSFQVTVSFQGQNEHRSVRRTSSFPTPLSHGLRGMKLRSGRKTRVWKQGSRVSAKGAGAGLFSPLACPPAPHLTSSDIMDFHELESDDQPNSLIPSLLKEMELDPNQTFRFHFSDAELAALREQVKLDKDEGIISC